MRMRSDAKLVELARRGSHDAAAELFTRHWRAAWRAAYVVTGRRELADDVAQDAFERAFGTLSRFDERRPFGPWLTGSSSTAASTCFGPSGGSLAVTLSSLGSNGMTSRPAITSCSTR
jgi:hypothetical protein